MACLWLGQDPLLPSVSKSMAAQTGGLFLACLLSLLFPRSLPGNVRWGLGPNPAFPGWVCPPGHRPRARRRRPAGQHPSAGAAQAARPRLTPGRDPPPRPKGARRGEAGPGRAGPGGGVGVGREQRGSPRCRALSEGTRVRCVGAARWRLPLTGRGAEGPPAPSRPVPPPSGRETLRGSAGPGPPRRTRRGFSSGGAGRVGGNGGGPVPAGVGGDGCPGAPRGAGAGTGSCRVGPVVWVRPPPAPHPPGSTERKQRGRRGTGEGKEGGREGAAAALGRRELPVWKRGAGPRRAVTRSLTALWAHVEKSRFNERPRNGRPSANYRWVRRLRGAALGRSGAWGSAGPGPRRAHGSGGVFTHRLLRPCTWAPDLTWTRAGIWVHTAEKCYVTFAAQAVWGVTTLISLSPVLF